MFDAYTIKKVMPRLVIAMILIQLSWPILTTAITAVNQISWGIESLVYLPFGGSDAVNINALLGKTEPGGRAKNGATKSDDGIDNTAFMTLIGGGLVWMVGFSAVGLLGLLIAVLMAIVVAFVTLAVRQVVIILLVLVAPLALVAWILPNTEKLWKMWWDMFIKALMMYPLILLLIAGGKIGAFVVIQSGLSDVVKIVMAIVLYFIPFFLLGKTMAMAGGAIGAVSGAISARGSKLTAMANKRGLAKQGQKWSARKEKFQAGGYGSDRNKFTKGLRRVGQMSGQSVWTGFGTTGKGKGRMALEASHGANELLKDGKFVEATYDDDARLALQMGNEKSARSALAAKGLSADKINASINKAKAAGGFNTQTQLAALKAEASNKGRNYKGLAGVDALNNRIDAIAAATGVNADDLRSEVGFGMRTQGGRFDLGALDSSKSSAEQAIDGWNKGSLYQHSNSQANSMKTIHEAMRQTTGNRETDAQRLAVFHEEASQMAPNATGDIATELEAIMGDGSATHQFVESYYASGPQTSTPGRMEKTIVDHATGNSTTRVVEDPDPTHARKAPTRKLAASKEARVYRPTNPNEIE